MIDSQEPAVFPGRFWDCTGGGGSVGSVTHCGDAAPDWRGALPSTRVDEEESVSVDEVEAMIPETPTGFVSWEFHKQLERENGERIQSGEF